VLAIGEQEHVFWFARGGTDGQVEMHPCSELLKPVPAPYVPLGQAMQVVAPEILLQVPELHCRQNVTDLFAE